MNYRISKLSNKASQNFHVLNGPQNCLNTKKLRINMHPCFITEHETAGQINYKEELCV